MLIVGLAGSGHGPVISLLLLGALILAFVLFCWVCYMLWSFPPSGVIDVDAEARAASPQIRRRTQLRRSRSPRGVG
jgi:hypothetical protein